MPTPRRCAPAAYRVPTRQTPHPDLDPADLPPGPIALFELTARTLGGQLLLRPDDKLNHLILGILGRAQRLTRTHIFAYHVLSNHLSILVGVHSCAQLAKFSNAVFGQIALRVTALRGRPGKLWARRNRAIPLLASPAVQIDRLRYNLSNATKEDLVTHARHWPGVHAAHWFCDQTPQTGAWFDATTWNRLRRRAPDLPREAGLRHYTVHLAKLPCLEHLSDPDYAAQIQAWTDEDARDAKAKREASQNTDAPIPEPGDPHLLTQVDPFTLPQAFTPTPAPLAHCEGGKAGAQARAYRKLYRAYCATLREARALLAAGLSILGIDLSAGLLPTGWSSIPIPCGPDVPLGPPACASA